MTKILLALLYTMFVTIAFTGCGQGGETGSTESPVSGSLNLYTPSNSPEPEPEPSYDQPSTSTTVAGTEWEDANGETISFDSYGSGEMTASGTPIDFDYVESGTSVTITIMGQDLNGVVSGSTLTIDGALVYTKQ